MIASKFPQSAYSLLLAWLLCGTLVYFPEGIARSSAIQTLSVTEGKAVTFGVETDVDAPRYSWALTRNGRMESAQAEKFFTYVFPSTGVWELMLTIRSDDGREETHAFTIESEPNISIGPAESAELHAVLRSEPPAVLPERIVTLQGDGGSLILFSDESTGRILEYRIDVNTDIDGDGNGVTDDDADNRLDPSFSNGTGFPVSMFPIPGEAEREILLRVIGRDGSMSEERITVLFSQSAMLVPVLSTFPPADASDAAIHLPSDGGIVRFVASQSVGGAVQFFLDLDLDRDTNGDGLHGNDSDAAGTAFERNGSEIAFFLRPFVKNRRSIALTVMDSFGASAIENKIVIFGTGEESAPVPSIGDTQAADDVAGQNLRIDVTVQNLEASFRPAGFSDDGSLFPTWNFGDGETSYLLAPTHAYGTEGTYKVRLTFADPRSGLETQIAETSVTVRGVPPPPSTESGKGFFVSVLQSFAFIFRVAFFVLILLCLLAGAAVAFIWIIARRKGKSLKDALHGYVRRFSSERQKPEEEKSVPEIIEAAAVHSLEEEPTPVKLSAEPLMKEEKDVKEEVEQWVEERAAEEQEAKVEEREEVEQEAQDDTTSESGEIKGHIDAPMQSERGALPPWMQEGGEERLEGTEEIKEDKEDKVPAWLAEGLKKAVPPPTSEPDESNKLDQPDKPTFAPSSLRYEGASSSDKAMEDNPVGEPNKPNQPPTPPSISSPITSIEPAATPPPPSVISPSDEQIAIVRAEVAEDEK